MLTRLTELLETQKVSARNMKPASVQYLVDRARALRTLMQESSRRGAARWRVCGRGMRRSGRGATERKNCCARR